MRGARLPRRHHGGHRDAVPGCRRRRSTTTSATRPSCWSKRAGGPSTASIGAPTQAGPPVADVVHTFASPGVRRDRTVPQRAAPRRAARCRGRRPPGRLAPRPGRPLGRSLVRARRAGRGQDVLRRCCSACASSTPSRRSQPPAGPSRAGPSRCSRCCSPRRRHGDHVRRSRRRRSTSACCPRPSRPTRRPPSPPCGSGARCTTPECRHPTSACRARSTCPAALRDDATWSSKYGPGLAYGELGAGRARGQRPSRPHDRASGHLAGVQAVGDRRHGARHPRARQRADRRVPRPGRRRPHRGLRHGVAADRDVLAARHPDGGHRHVPRLGAPDGRSRRLRRRRARPRRRSSMPTATTTSTSAPTSHAAPRPSPPARTSPTTSSPGC